jgi:hypothetical protein
MEVRADKFLSGHYAYFAELPERVPLELRINSLIRPAAVRIVYNRKEPEIRQYAEDKKYMN